MRALVLLAVAGCAYKPGSFTHFRQEFPGQRTTVGCIDVAIERRPDLTSGGTVLAYEFGNRCDRPATIDLANAKVLAQTFGGQRMELHPYDPNDEIRSLRIDGRTAGAEAIAYPANERLAQVCVDAASIAGEFQSRWLCFSSNLPPPVHRLAEVSP